VYFISRLSGCPAELYCGGWARSRWRVNACKHTHTTVMLLEGRGCWVANMCVAGSASSLWLRCSLQAPRARLCMQNLSHGMLAAMQKQAPSCIPHGTIYRKPWLLRHLCTRYDSGLVLARQRIANRGGYAKPAKRGPITLITAYISTQTSLAVWEATRPCYRTKHCAR
jgi:hypothetical protein